MRPSRSEGWRSSRAICGMHSAERGASSSLVASVPCQAPSPKRIAKSSPSAARSTRLLLVESRRSMKGCRSEKAESRGRSQPTAKVPTAPTVRISRMRSPRKRSTAVAMRSKLSRRTGRRVSPSGVIISPRGRRLNSAVPSCSSNPLTWWLTAACVTFSSMAARVKLRWRAEASKARKAFSGRYGRTMTMPKFF